MKFKKCISSLAVAATMLATVVTPQSYVFAVSSFASVQDFLTDAIELSMTNITSTTKTEAVEATKSKVTMSGDQVLFDSIPIGYWYSDESSTLYADSGRTSVLIEEVADGYKIEPSVLETLLEDVNNNLIENYVPTTDDWSKIVGKYDITLGDVTIPADQWVSLEIVETLDSPEQLLNMKTAANLSTEDAISNHLVFGAYWMDSDNNLYLSDVLSTLELDGNIIRCYTYACSTGTRNEMPWYGTNGYTAINLKGDYPIFKLGVAYPNDNTKVLGIIPYAYSIGNSYVYAKAYSKVNNMLNITDPTNISDIDYSEATITGLFWAKTDGSDTGELAKSLYQSYSISKLVRGNTTLTKRLSKLASLTASDTVTVKTTGWYVLDGQSLDTYIATQNMNNAGDTADINAVAEVEPLMFNVIVPTTLPIYVAADGTVSTANNATVVNKSNAAVRITDIDITGKPESGWTLVDANPSNVRDAKEFTFTTSLAVGDILTRNQVFPFTYAANLSPMTSGEDNLDLATVSVTVDWAD